ncbi:hypothetical protein F53441_264 [Fusarium austroafricanum]|uniref:Uncharacterized protein n=1 Tax=Fusarium austroafricanum TaxID=2364996 RepID=A0A8H4KW96_9HYPO|nr:hypothetical protein F53441_264 [Fusarium austroafricanum]
MLDYLLAVDINRLKQLCARVKSLCTIIQFKKDFWHLLPFFTNLNSLELYGDTLFPDKEEDISFDLSALLFEPSALPFDQSAPTLPKLRCAKLNGVIPSAVAAWVMRSSPNIERLELELVDRGISTRSKIFFTPPMDPRNGWYPLYSDVMEWSTVPRPLSGFLPGPEDVTSLKLPQLRHLHLCQSSHGERDWLIQYRGLFRSKSTEVAAHDDWEQILIASRHTLNTLLIEQRAGAEHDDEINGKAPGDADDFLVFRRYRDGIASKGLTDMLERVLKETEFPALKRVILKGIVVGSEKYGKPIGDVPGGRLMRFLEKMNIPCEARLGEGYWLTSNCGMQPPAEWLARRLRYEDVTKDERYGVELLNDSVAKLNSEELLAIV